MLIVIKADTNDGDYITSINMVDDESIELLTPLLKAVKANSGNWPYHDYVDMRPEDIYKDFDEEVIDLLNGLVPRGEFGIHTIEEVTVYAVHSEKKLY